MWLNVISINLMQLSKRMLFTEWKNVWFTRYQLIGKLNKLCEDTAAVNKLENHLQWLL